MDKKEWRLVIIVSLVVIASSTLPLIFGYLITPDGKEFLFTSSINVSDSRVYFSYIEQAKAGQLFFKNFFTSESQPMGFLNPFWLLVGASANIFNLPSALAFHAVRIILIPVFLFIAYYFLAFFLPEVHKRKIAFIFLVFASGWGSLIHKASFDKGFWPLDINVAETFSFTVLYFSPHFIASLSLIMLIFLFSLKAFKLHEVRFSLFAGILAFLLISFYPYFMPAIFGVLFVFIVRVAIKNKKIDFQHLIYFVIILILSLPAFLYHAWTVFNIPVVYGHYLQNLLPTPPLYIVLMSCGLLIPLALVGAFPLFLKKEPRIEEIFLLVWFFTQFALIYFPIKTQRKLIEGWSVALVILVIYGIFYLKDSIMIKKIVDKYFKQENRVGKLINNAGMIGICIILFCSSNITIVANDIFHYLNNDKALYRDLFYISKDEKQSFLWLKNTPEDSVILSSYLHNASLIPAWSFRHVFLGHDHETNQFDKKFKETSEFFTDSNSQERLTFLQESDIDYILLNKQEAKNMAVAFDNEAFLEKVFQNNSVTIYKVERETW